MKENAFLSKTVPMILLFMGIIIYGLGQMGTGTLLMVIAAGIAFYFKYQQYKQKKLAGKASSKKHSDQSHDRKD